MSKPTQEDIKNQLKTIHIEEVNSDPVTAGIISSIIIKDDSVAFVIEALPSIKSNIETIRKKCEEKISQLPGIKKVTAIITEDISNPNIIIGSKSKAENTPKPPTPTALPGIKNVILVGAGKGGVGKSMVAANIAVTLANMGFKTGLADADIYGPSIARMMKITAQPEIQNNQMIPPENYGVKCMSMGFLLNEESPVVWRGPMISKALHQLIKGANWGGLDYLIIDMPPGTGDIQLSIVQNFNVNGAVIVSTPQEIALLDVQKCINMFRKVNVNILGFVENMAYFIDPTGNKNYLFGSGATEKLSNYGLEKLGEIPVIPEISKNSDAGIPAIKEPSVAEKFNQICKKIVSKLPA